MKAVLRKRISGVCLFAQESSLFHHRDPDENREHCAAMLRTAMGPEIALALADPLVLMVNPDGLLRLDRFSEGRSQTKSSPCRASWSRSLVWSLATCARKCTPTFPLSAPNCFRVITGRRAANVSRA